MPADVLDRLPDILAADGLHDRLRGDFFGSRQEAQGRTRPRPRRGVHPIQPRSSMLRMIVKAFRWVQSRAAASSSSVTPATAASPSLAP